MKNPRVITRGGIVFETDKKTQSVSRIQFWLMDRILVEQWQHHPVQKTPRIDRGR